MKKKLVPIITVSLAAAFAAGPSFAHARPASAAFLTIPQDQEKPPEKPPAKPQEPSAKPPENPPAHEPDAKPPAKPEEKPRQEENPPNRPANNEEKPKPVKQPKQDNKMTQNHNDQNKKSVHAQQNVHYSFRSQDKTTLKQHFDTQIRSVDRSHREHIRVGGFIPQESVTLIQPVPVEVIGLLPPIPEGCVVGFWDGFIVVYYPDDFYVVSYIDLL
jgi:outer membrane biosynthesis protein TonB